MDCHDSDNIEADITCSGVSGSGVNGPASPVQSYANATLGNGVNHSSSSSLGVPMITGSFNGNGSDRKRTRRTVAADDEAFEDILGQSMQRILVTSLVYVTATL